MKSHFDFVIVGAGILGAAVTKELAAEFPGKSIAVIEKESKAAQHQSGRNSGVIHAGVYYPPGSLKAQYCKEGLHATIELCKRHAIPYEQCGKIVIATSDEEEARLANLYERCNLNGLSPQMLTRKQISQKEPNISGVAGMWVKQTGITDFKTVTQCLLEQTSETADTTFFYSTEVIQIDEKQEQMDLYLKQEKNPITLHGDYLICCAGVYADELIRKQGLPCDFKIIPFRGEYYRLNERFNEVSQRLVYPVPDPTMPFLGVHLTKMIGGYTTVGPNAVLAAGREAYSSFNLNPKELWRLATSPGLYRLLWKFKGNVMTELKTSLSKRHYVEQIRRYCPSVREDDLSPYRPGIRAQAVKSNGELVHDFKFVSSERALHVGNAPSPAATSAIPIARAIISKIKGTK